VTIFNISSSIPPPAADAEAILLGSNFDIPAFGRFTSAPPPPPPGSAVGPFEIVADCFFFNTFPTNSSKPILSFLFLNPSFLS
jgi:hypothetical protein